MNIKLHNKYEITIGDKTYVAYNTITNKIFDAIYSFTKYGSSIAVGCGTEELGYDNPRLSQHIYNYPTVLEEIQCDPSKGTMYVKRTTHLTQAGNTYDITELGLTDKPSTNFNSTVYSHVYIRDEDGNITPIHKSSDLDLFIRVTMYLQIDDQTKTFLTAGDNLLVKAILGELDTVPEIKVARGYNYTANDTFVNRNMLRDSKKYSVKASRASEDNVEKIVYSFDVRSGETAELVLLFDDTPVARFNTIGMGSRTFLSLESATSQDNYTLDIGENIVNIDSVTDSNGEAVSQYKPRIYATDFTDFITNPFEANFTSQCARWISYDGDKVAFVADGTLYIYQNKNYALYKINHNIASNNLNRVMMFENYIFAIYSISPYFEVYSFDDTLTATKIATNMQVYDNFESSYDWKEVQIIKDDNSNFIIGIVLGAIARRPVLLKASIVNDIFTITSAEYGKSDYVVHSFSLYKNNFCNSMIGFITNNYNLTADTYRIEQWSPDYSYEITNEIPAYYLCNNTSVVEGKSRAVIAKKTEAPYIWIYYYPQMYRYSISLTQGIENWISTNLMYIIQKYDDSQTPYKIYSLNDYNNPQEFQNGFPSEIDLSTVTDFEFLNDTLIIFTSTQTYALNLKQNRMVLENMPEANATYSVSAVQESLIGTSSSQGVMGSFEVVFNI